MYILYLVLNAAQNSSCTYSLRFKMPSVLSCALYSLSTGLTSALDKSDGVSVWSV